MPPNQNPEQIAHDKIDDLRKVTPSAHSAKTHYVFVDAIGVTQSLKTANQPLITRPSVPLKDLAMGIMMGASDNDMVKAKAAANVFKGELIDSIRREITYRMIRDVMERLKADRPTLAPIRVWNAYSQQEEHPAKSGGKQPINELTALVSLMIRDHISSPFHFERDDMEMAPFDSRGGLGKMFQPFGADMDGLIDEMNAELAA